MKEITKPIKGQTLFSLNVGNRVSQYSPQKLTRVKVAKVGRKYFTIGEGRSETQFHLTDWRQKSEYSATQRIYETEQSYLDEVEVEKICNRIDKAFEYGRNQKGITLRELRKINQIIIDTEL